MRLESSALPRQATSPRVRVAHLVTDEALAAVSAHLALVASSERAAIDAALWVVGRGAADSGLPGMRIAASFAGAIRRLAAALRREQIAVLHTHTARADAIAALAGAAVRRVSTQWYPGVRSAVHRWALRRFDRIYAPSRAAARALREAGLRGEHVRWAPPPFDAARFATVYRRRTTPGRPPTGIVTCFGPLVASPALLDILAAFAAARAGRSTAASARERRRGAAAGGAGAPHRSAGGGSRRGSRRGARRPGHSRARRRRRDRLSARTGRPPGARPRARDRARRRRCRRASRPSRPPPGRAKLCPRTPRRPARPGLPHARRPRAPGRCARGAASAAKRLGALGAAHRAVVGRELEVVERRELAPEGELDGVRRPVALLGDDDLRDVLLVAVLVVDLVAVDERDHVGVLLDGARLAQVGEPGLGRVAVLDLPIELRERDHGHVELLGEGLERARDLGDLLLAAVLAFGAAHELEVVDHDEAEPRARLALEPPRLRPQLEDAQRGRVVDVDGRVGEPPGGHGEPRELPVGEVAGAHAREVDLRLGAEEPHRELLLRH